jgi:hypothetical protein
MVCQCRKIATQKCADTQETMLPNFPCRDENRRHFAMSPTCRRHYHPSHLKSTFTNVQCTFSKQSHYFFHLRGYRAQNQATLLPNACFLELFLQMTSKALKLTTWRIERNKLDYYRISPLISCFTSLRQVQPS